MKAATLILLMFVSSYCFAYKEVEYRVEGKLTGQLNGNYAYLQIFSNQFQKSQVIQTAIVNKIFVFTGKIKCAEDEICMARLFITDKPGFTLKDIMILIKTVNYDMRNIVLEKNVIVEVEHSVKEAKVTDGELNDINNLFHSVELKYQKEQDELDKWYKGQQNKYAGISSELQRISAEYFELNRELQQEKFVEILELVKRFPFSKQAMERFMMLAVMNENTSAKYQQLLEDAWNDLPEETQTTKDGQKILAKLTKTWEEITLKEGNILPDYSFKMENGGLLQISGFRGRYLLIDFWTSWCAPCRAEHYNMKQAYEQYKSENFSILQVSLDEKKAQWLKAIKEDQLPWINVRSENGWDKELEKLFNIQGVPTNYLVDPEGKIIVRNLRGEDLKNWLSKIFL